MRFGTQADREYRPPHDGRNDTFEAAAVERKFRLENRPLVIHDGSLPGGDGVQRARRLGWRHRTDVVETFTHPLGPQRESGFRTISSVASSASKSSTVSPNSRFNLDSRRVCCSSCPSPGFALEWSPICVVYCWASGGRCPLLCRPPGFAVVTEAAEVFGPQDAPGPVITIPFDYNEKTGSPDRSDLHRRHGCEGKLV